MQRYPVDSLKFDRSFVSGLGTNPGDTIIVEAIIGMAKTLGLATVAEGVETAEQRDELRVLGCTFGQGYLFADLWRLRTSRHWLTDATALARSIGRRATRQLAQAD